MHWNYKTTKQDFMELSGNSLVETMGSLIWSRDIICLHILYIEKMRDATKYFEARDLDWKSLRCKADADLVSKYTLLRAQLCSKIVAKRKL